MKSELAAHYDKKPQWKAYLPGLGVFEREVRRFMKVPTQTIGSPIGSSLLYFTIFHFSLGRLVTSQPGANTALSLGLNYIEFLIPGVMAMETANGAFQNPVSSIIQSKWSGTIVDQLMAPLSPLATLLAYIGGGVIRTFIVASATYFAGALFSQSLPMHNFALLLLGLLLSVSIFSSLGVLAGFWCKSFDQVGMIGTFILQPLMFLSGVFFSFQSFPENISWLPYLNPAFYIVNLFRYALVGVSDVSPLIAFPTALVFALCLFGSALKFLQGGKIVKM